MSNGVEKNGTAGAAARVQQKPPSNFTKWIRANGAGYALVSPMLIGIFVFVFYPMLMVLLYSFQDTNGLSGRWVGLQNYRWVLTDPMFWRALGNTIYMAIMAIILDVIFCFVTASLINSLVHGKNIFKSIYFLPNVVSSVATALLFNFIFYPTQAGILNAALGFFGISPVGWLTSPTVAPISIVIMGIWRSVGYDTILFLAGLQSIPREIYEAASVDGATGIQKWLYITIPCMKPTFSFIIIMLTLSTLRRFDDVWLIGGIGGNPGGSLQTMVLYIYRNAWTAQEVGVGSAASLLLFVFMLGVTACNYKLTGADKAV